MKTSCAYCGKVNDLHMEVSKSTKVPSYEPTPGAASICATCHLISIFTDELTLRKPTTEEQDLLNNDEGVQQVLLLLNYSKA
jgi:hypothetical protein